jgi:uncharacterized protein
MLLPDVNVWLALTFDFHAHHVAAKSWYEGSNETCAFCRWTQQGFLRLATNAAVFKEEAVSLKQAWGLYDAILSDARVVFAEEPKDLESYWRAYTRRRSFSPKVWSDAYLAAFARAAGSRVATFDKGLAQYKGVHCSILS